MISNIAGVNKLDIPYGIFSNVNGNKLAKVSDNVINGMKKYYSNKEGYREKLTTLFDKVGALVPIENKINNVIYTDNYLEKGVAIPRTSLVFKQAWLEYRLMYNENKQKKGEVKMNNNIELPNIPFENKKDNFFTTESYVLDNFDEIFDKLSRRVDGVNHYIDELKEKQTSIQNTKNNIEFEKQEINKARQKLEQDKLQFEKYKTDKEKELEKEQNKLKSNCAKFQSLVDKIDNRLTNME